MASHPTPILPNLQPTYVGHIDTEQDALLIIEACLSGRLSHIPRFPLQKEREGVIRSGSVYVYAHISTGEGAWDDGREWEDCGHLGRLVIQRCSATGRGFLRKSGSYPVQGVAHGFIFYHESEDVHWHSSHNVRSTSAALATPSQDSSFATMQLRPGLDYFLRQSGACAQALARLTWEVIGAPGITGPKDHSNQPPTGLIAPITTYSMGGLYCTRAPLRRALRGYISDCHTMLLPGDGLA